MTPKVKLLLYIVFYDLQHCFYHIVSTKSQHLKHAICSAKRTRRFSKRTSLARNTRLALLHVEFT
jgi:hypothetical protein